MTSAAGGMGSQGGRKQNGPDADNDGNCTPPVPDRLIVGRFDITSRHDGGSFIAVDKYIGKRDEEGAWKRVLGGRFPLTLSLSRDFPTETCRGAGQLVMFHVDINICEHERGVPCIHIST